MDYDDVAISPDGRQAAVAVRDWLSGERDIWLVETERGVKDQFTVDSPEAGFPIWAPDASSIVYAASLPTSGDGTRESSSAVNERRSRTSAAKTGQVSATGR